MSRRPFRATCVLLTACMALATGCATSGPPPDPADPNAFKPPGPTVGQRGQAAFESMVMGAVLGLPMAGPLGAAVGAGTMLIYGAVTGNVPLSRGGVSGGPRSEKEREKELEAAIEQEMERQGSLESQIEAELQRQEDLLASIEKDESDRLAKEALNAPAEDLSAEEVAERADPRVAPRAPSQRDLPAYIFEEDQVRIDAGRWSNRKPLDAARLRLDADRDGKPEEIRFVDPQTGQMLRWEEDRDFNGTLDAWSNYQDGALVSRDLDMNDDGRRDVWERYAGGRMISRETDRNYDGKRDAFYTYENDALMRERHDTDDDGNVDFVIHYQDRRRVSSEEDSDKDGGFDTWTQYVADGNEDVVSRIERDKSGDGKADTFETYAREKGESVLTLREEDKNGDGVVDVTSIYEKGKLVRREIADPALMPL